MATMLVAQNDVQTALLRPLTDTETSFIDDLCVKASELLRLAMPAIDDRIGRYGTDDPSALNPVVVSAMLAEVIKRCIVNPDGVATKNEAVGPFSRSFSFGGNGNGVLAITENDLDRLKPPAASFVMPSTIRVNRHHHRTFL